MPSHINAVGDYARAVRKLLPSLLPDLTDTETARPFGVTVMSASHCAQSLPATSSRPAVDFNQEQAVVAKGFRQRWTPPGSKTESFCGFVVVANLCGTPLAYTLGFEGFLPVDQAHPQFDANYNVSLARGSLQDVVPAYGTSVLRLGCEGFVEGCDRTGGVC